MKTFFTLFLSAVLSCSTFIGLSYVETGKLPILASTTSNSYENLTEMSVLIMSDAGHGSGTLITRHLVYNGVEGDYNIILTCGHIVDQLKDKDGKITDANLYAGVPVYNEEGVVVDINYYTLKIIKFADRENEDVAVLILSENQLTNKSPSFLEKGYAKPGTSIVHVGSPKHPNLINSLMFGHVSATGRMVGNFNYQQVQVGISGGCSGGGVYNDRGEYIGMIARTMGESYGLMIPIKTIRKWLHDNDMDWVLKQPAEIVHVVV